MTEIFNPIAASLLVYVIPISIGSSFVKITRKIFKISKEPHEITSLFNLFFYFSIGTILIFTTALIINIINPNNFFNIFKICIYVTSLLTIGINIIFEIYDNIKSFDHFKIRLKTAGTLFIILIISAVTFTIWKWDSPLNASLNWDLYHHQLIVNKIQKSEFNFSPSKLSDTYQFPSYPTTFFTLMSVPQSLLNINIVNFWWFIEFVHLFSTGIAIYLLAYTLFRNQYISYTAVLMSSFFFESNGAYTTLFLIPQNVVATFTIVFIGKIIHNYKYGGNIIKPELIIFILFLGLNHYVIGSLGIFLLIFTTVLLLIDKKVDLAKTKNLLPIVTLVIATALYFYSGKVDLSYINRGEAGGYTPSIYEKVVMFKDFYGWFFIVFLPIGTLYLALKKEFEYKLFSILTIGTMLLFVANIPYTSKLLSVGRYFIIILMATGFVVITKKLPKIFKIISYMGLIATLLLIFVSNISKYKQSTQYRNICSNVSYDEIKAADFIRENYYKKNALIISEPATMHIIETLSKVNSPGGAYTTENIRQILSEIYYKRDATLLKENLNKVVDGLSTEKTNIRLLIISNRYEEWQKLGEKEKMGINANIWAPSDLTLCALNKESFIYYLRNQTDLKEVYSNKNIVVFEVPII